MVADLLIGGARKGRTAETQYVVERIELRIELLELMLGEVTHPQVCRRDALA